MSTPSLAALLAAALVCAGCSPKTREYDASVELRRLDVIRLDQAGKPLTMDVEFEWATCPGEQREVIRGDAAFADCMTQHKVGEKLPVRVRWSAEASGGHDWDVIQIGSCRRPTDTDDETSFDMVHECAPINEHGVNIGFHCDHLPHKELLARCPWFDRY